MSTAEEILKSLPSSINFHKPRVWFVLIVEVDSDFYVDGYETGTWEERRRQKPFPNYVAKYVYASTYYECEKCGKCGKDTEIEEVLDLKHVLFETKPKNTLLEVAQEMMFFYLEFVKTFDGNYFASKKHMKEFTKNYWKEVDKLNAEIAKAKASIGTDKEE